MDDQDKKRSMMDARELSEEIRRLIRTPVGRRLLLKLGGASALTLTIGGLGGCGEDEERAPSPTPAPTASPTPTQRPREVRHIFCALGDTAGVQNPTLSVGGITYALQSVTEADRTQLVSAGGGYRLMDMAMLSHVARDVDLPSDRPLLLHVTGQLGADTVYVAETIHVPRESMVFAWKAALALAGSVSQLLGDVSWLTELGVTALEQLTAEHLADLTATITPSSIAAALAYKHPEVASLESDSSAITMTLLLANPGVSDLATQIAQMLQQGIPYAVQVPILDENGQPIYITDPDTGASVQALTMQINSDLNDRFGRAVRLGVNDVKNSMDLEGKTWNLTPGTPPQPQPASSVGAPADDAFNITQSRTGYNWGVKVTIDSFDPTTRTIPIKVWNNYVRYLSAYVQYLDGQGNPLPISNPSGQDTQYSQFLVNVQDMPELFGIPFMENHNYGSATLTFPDGATAARLLICSLGSNRKGPTWRDFFPADAYPDRVNPDECSVPVLFTSLFDIGIPVMFLAMDVSTATVLQTARSYLKQDVMPMVRVLSPILRSLEVLSIAAVFIAGGVTATQLQNAGVSELASMWNVLKDTASILGHLFALEGSRQIFIPIIISISYQKGTQALPILGEVLAAAAAMGDAAQLAQVSAETANSPWVIDNTIHVTYTATVTLQHDLNDAAFPRSATQWTLTPVIGGAGSRDPITGAVTPVGTRQEPIGVTVPDVPIGGGTVQYAVTFTNADGAQVGKGTSAVLPNNDVNNLPRTVEITIQEIAIPITANTVFQRQNTTAYATADKGYTWTPTTQIAGTVQDTSGLIEINAISVGTVSGMAGYVWRAGTPPQYWIRNLPTLQDAGQTTIQLQTGGPYARKPLVVYDRLNPDLRTGNNFLLEPDDQGTGYQVRRLTLSANGGTLGWNAGESWGQFLNPLSAVTLHPSGYLVGVNAETGKLDIHKIPANPTDDTNLPPLASSYAGPGTRPGLTQTPVGVAITITSMVVVLEAGANQLQCFDLAGNPVAYFGTDPNNPSYYAALASGANDTLLSLAVDGQGWFYVLSYTGDGAQVSDYAVDVYDVHGTHVVRSPGLNAATFDVDYWRNIFALNYAPLANTDGSAHVDATTGVVEPSTSICIPRNG
jgi:hypothetical protein